MAAPQPRSWENLMVASLHEILRRVPCPVDRLRVYLVCRAWRDAVDAFPPPKPPRALPWLLLPARQHRHPGSSATRVVCPLSGLRDHHYLTSAPPGARCFGSHDGAWLFLQFREQRSHEFVNVRTGHVHVLPRVLVRRGDPHRHIHNVFIHAAALSSSPAGDTTSYIGAAIVTFWRSPAPGVVPLPRRGIAFWLEGAPRFMEIALALPGDGDVSMGVEDVLYTARDHSFLFLTQGEHLRRCTPVVNPGNGLMETEWMTIRFRPGGWPYDQHVRSRYLVMSRGVLLMVVRFTPQPHQPTSKFKVFRVRLRNDAEADADFPVNQYPLAWSELDALDGRMLFVGHGCSRSYEADDYPYPGFKDGIYFLDDAEFLDAPVIFGDGNVRLYPCSDNGIWSDGRVQRCFPRSDPTGHSAPVWLLP